ncbi:MAG: class I SAM-dependent methyltransferase [Alphaproteobacteria bacterium]|nr:class I SAM-dependent methyltransferase [Alphaproteobacteria bacterium]
MSKSYLQFLEKTTYTNNMQNAIIKLAKFLKPISILDMNFGSGILTYRMAKEFPNVQVLGVDGRDSANDLGQEIVKNNKDVSNLQYYKEDMSDFVKFSENIADLNVMFYSFSKIKDPVENKLEFLSLCRNRMFSETKILIADIFEPDTKHFASKVTEFKARHEKRALQGFSDTFWNSLTGLTEVEIQEAEDRASNVLKYEQNLASSFLSRGQDYPVSLDWLLEELSKMGFKIDLVQPVSAFGEAIVLFSLKDKNPPTKKKFDPASKKFKKLAMGKIGM